LEGVLFLPVMRQPHSLLEAGASWGLWYWSNKDNGWQYNGNVCGVRVARVWIQGMRHLVYEVFNGLHAKGHYFNSFHCDTLLCTRGSMIIWPCLFLVMTLFKIESHVPTWSYIY